MNKRKTKKDVRVSQNDGDEHHSKRHICLCVRGVTEGERWNDRKTMEGLPGTVSRPKNRKKDERKSNLYFKTSLLPTRETDRRQLKSFSGDPL